MYLDENPGCKARFPVITSMISIFLRLLTELESGLEEGLADPLVAFDLKLMLLGALLMDFFKPWSFFTALPVDSRSLAVLFFL